MCRFHLVIFGGETKQDSCYKEYFGQEKKSGDDLHCYAKPETAHSYFQPLLTLLAGTRCMKVLDVVRLCACYFLSNHLHPSHSFFNWWMNVRAIVVSVGGFEWTSVGLVSCTGWAFGNTWSWCQEEEQSESGRGAEVREEVRADRGLTTRMQAGTEAGHVHKQPGRCLKECYWLNVCRLHYYIYHVN